MKKTMETIPYHDHNNAINTNDYSFRKKLAENKFFIYDERIMEKFEDYDQFRKSIVKNCAFKNPIFLDTILDFSTVKKLEITFDLNNKKVIRKRVDDYNPLYCYAISTIDKEQTR